MNMRNAVLALFLFGTLPIVQVHAQITVFDAPNEVHFAATVETLKSELEQVRNVAASINGVRDLGQNLRNLPISSVLPVDLQALYRSLSTLPSSHSASLCFGRNSAATALCQFDAAKTALDLTLAASLYAEAPTHQNQIDLLQAAFLGTPDLKSSADLGVRTSLTSASLDAQRIQIELFAMQSSLEDQAIAKARRLDQLERVSTDARAIDSLQPVDFGSLP